MRQIFRTVAVCMTLLPGVAGACEILEPFEVASLAAADIVLIGEVSGYQELNDAPGAALVTVRVAEVVKGKAETEMVLIWNSGMAMGPFEERARGKVVIGAMATGRAVSEWTYDERPDLPMIVQPYCGDVWLQPATAALVAEVKSAIGS
jgi:hypothetical protein